MRAFSYLFPAFAGLVLLVLRPGAALGQWPGEVEGRVLDRMSGTPVAGASIHRSRAPSNAVPAITNGSGHFRLRSLEPGSRFLTIRHPGYAPARIEVEVRPGRTSQVQVLLDPVPMPVKGLEVGVERRPSEGSVLEPGPGEATRSLADLVEGVPGTVVTGRGPAGPRTISIRGSDPGQVLVLVDGVPLNDPVTGVADLSLLSAAAVRRVVVLSGARSARYGPRAQGGVLIVETGGGRDGMALRGSAGSLGRAALGVEVGRRDGSRTWTVGVNHERIGGAFRFRRPPEVGGGVGTRVNGDTDRTGVHGHFEAGLAGGQMDLRFQADRVDRGLPGRSFAPSPRARQEDGGGQLALGWSAPPGGPRGAIEVRGAFRRSRARDPHPPAGLAWDQRSLTRTLAATLRLDPVDIGPARIGGELGWSGMGVDVDALSAEAPSVRHDLQVRLFSPNVLSDSLPLRLRAAVGLDQTGSGSGSGGRLHLSHELTAVLAAGSGLTAHAAHRSAFTPPSLADQYFREGVGVEPNPDLRGERIPSEVELGVSWSGALGPARLALSGTTFRGDVEGMIVWAPDFRFVWSPRNRDVLRRGAELRGQASAPLVGGRLAVSASWSRARVTRSDRPDVQVVYRPRHTGQLSASWQGAGMEVEVEARYTGRRNPVPSPVNVLPGFWTFDLHLGGSWSVGGWDLAPALEVERALDSTASMIFGFPEPGRRIDLGLEVRKSGTDR